MPRILVVDDDPDMRAMLQQTLQNAGHEVFSAADGREALKQNRLTAADLALVDIFMPNKDGFETIAQFRKEFPKVGLIAMSGRPPEAHVLTVAQRLGAIEVLQKPFVADEVLTAVAKVLARP